MDTVDLKVGVIILRPEASRYSTWWFSATELPAASIVYWLFFNVLLDRRANHRHSHHPPHRPPNMNSLMRRS